MSNVKHLKDKCNEDGINYFIVNQMPEAVKEHCRQTNELINEVKENVREYLRSSNCTTEYKEINCTSMGTYRDLSYQHLSLKTCSKDLKNK